MPNAYTLADLLQLMARLRDPDTGCPWDRAQDFRSIAPHTLEEVCEVIDAIERDDYPHLREELGDLLFQVVFYAQLGSERGLFDFAAIIDGLVAKLVARHPHVFPEGTLASRRRRRTASSNSGKPSRSANAPRAAVADRWAKYRRRYRR